VFTQVCQKVESTDKLKCGGEQKKEVSKITGWAVAGSSEHSWHTNMRRQYHHSHLQRKQQS